MAQQGDSLLRRSARRTAGNYGLGTGAIQVRQHTRGRTRKAAIRSVLHQECIAGSRSIDPVSDDQDCSPGAGCKVKLTFWVAAAIVFYAYLGYAGWLWLASRVRPWPLRRGQYLPFVSVVMVVRDEEKNLPHKLRNLASLEYPPDRIEFVIVSDGSTDATGQILAEPAKDGRWQALIFADRKGKASRLNEALAAAKGEVVLFVDARQKIEPNALHLLMENFAEDAEIGRAS